MTLGYLQQLIILVKRLLVCYFVYLICRLVFFWGNIKYFSETTSLDLLRNCLLGLRFDTFSIFVGSSLFILLSLLPINLFYKLSYQKILKWVFIIPNSIFILTNCIDIGYFPYIKKRSSADLFHQLAGQSDVSRLLPHYLKENWWIVILYFLLVLILILGYSRIKLLKESDLKKKTKKQWLTTILVFIISSGLVVLGIRGGMQRIPIDIVNAGSMTKISEVPILLNTPFTLIKSIDHQTLQEYQFYNASQLNSIYSPLHHFKSLKFKKENVVVIILESFSKEYTSLGGGKSLTPFLDSLMGQSLTFINGFSNGTKSIEGIPAILSSLPSLYENPFINSIYANNYQSSFATILSKEGYKTAFFHGGINGTMNFDDWSPLAGYEDYFGKNEYNNNSDFDGYWGIWDEPFLQYSVKKMCQFKEPFHSAIFTLSSHHPYFVPNKYKNKFPKGYLENSECIGYADYSLRQFFDSAKKTKWYNNTLFILTADHGSLSKNSFYNNPVGNLTIPILFFKPDNSLKKQNNFAFSQIDILPSALNYLGYNKPFFAFGNSYKDETNGHDYFYQNGTHFSYSDSIVFYFNQNKINAVYNFKQDSNLTKSIHNQYPIIDSIYTAKYRAFIQTYHHTLISNSGLTK